MTAAESEEGLLSTAMAVDSDERLVTALTAAEAAMYEEEAADPDCSMEPCEHCGRNFLASRLARHQAVCQGRKKAAQRRQFNARAQRLAEGAELNVPNAPTPEGPSRAERNERLKRQSEALRAAIKSARTAVDPSAAMQSDHAPVDPPAPIEEMPDDRVECPHCNRRFAPGPAERHIAKCQEIRAKPTTLKRMSMASPMLAPRLVQKEKQAGDKVLSPPARSPLHLHLHLHTTLSFDFVLSIHRLIHHLGSRRRAQRRPSKTPRRRRRRPRQSRLLIVQPRARRRRRRRRPDRPSWRRLAPQAERLRRARR